MYNFVAQAKALEKKPARKAALEKLQGDAFTHCLVNPFVEAARGDRRRSLRALSQAWISYLAHRQVTCLRYNSIFMQCKSNNRDLK